MADQGDAGGARSDGIRRVLSLLAIGGGVGRLRPAPGTWGSAATAVAIWAGWGMLPGWAWTVLALVVLLIGERAVAAYTRGRTEHDPSEVVIDEVAGMLTAAAVVAAGKGLPALAGRTLADASAAGRFGSAFATVLLIFLLFRLFDIAKPGPIGLIDRRMNSPLGAMLDDVLAGILSGIAAIAIFAVTS